jgi:hypothetical protein
MELAAIRTGTRPRFPVRSGSSVRESKREPQWPTFLLSKGRGCRPISIRKRTRIADLEGSQLNAIAPDKPFFCYYVPPGRHSCAASPDTRMDREVQGQVRHGRNDLRDQIFANQKKRPDLYLTILVIANLADRWRNVPEVDEIVAKRIDRTDPGCQARSAGVAATSERVHVDSP